MKGKRNLKRNYILLLLTTFFFIFTAHPFSVTAQEQTPTEQFRVGMEAGYAPFNWTQTSDNEDVVPIFGEEGSAYAGGYDVQIARKIADGLGKELVIVKVQWD